MKKFLALILALAMVMAMATTAMAATTDTINGGTNFDSGTANGVVQVMVEDTSATTVYKVDVTWSDLQFTYVFGSWNPSTHTYNEGSWKDDMDSATITIENHSNNSIDFSAQIEGGLTHADSTYGVTSTLTAGTVHDDDGEMAAEADSIAGYLVSADAAAYRNAAAPKATINLDISGTPRVFTTGGTFEDVGTITVTISKHQ